MTENNQDTNPKTAPKKPAKPRADQDQQLANDITESLEQIMMAKTDPEIAPLVAERGYDVAELDRGAALQGAAQTAYNARQTAMAASELASRALAAAEAEARATYAEFRETARVKFPGAEDQLALGLKGVVPKDLQKFTTTATGSYQAAQGAAYATALAKAGFKAERIAAALTALGKLPDLHVKARSAEGNAMAATATRNAAYKALMKWMGDFRRLAKLALKKKPALAAKLKL